MWRCDICGNTAAVKDIGNLECAHCACCAWSPMSGGGAQPPAIPQAAPVGWHPLAGLVMATGIAVYTVCAVRGMLTFMGW